MSLPVVAIVGRPNVGKSTLFNRLIGFQKSTVHDRAGVTRDRLYERATLLDRPVLAIDTGGLEPSPDTPLLEKMRLQTLVAVEEADVIVMVVDGRKGYTPADADVADLLRRSEKPVIVAVNKVDGPRWDDLVHDFYQLGLHPLLPVSAAHGRGFYELAEAILELLPPAAEAEAAEPELEDDAGWTQEVEREGAAEAHDFDDPDYDDLDALDDEAPPAPDAEAQGPIRIAVIGRPNIGKSTLINQLLGEERHLVMDMPGTTMDPIDSALRIGDDSFVLVDTAGVRRKARIDDKLERFVSLRSIKAIERCHISLLVIDAIEGLTEQDAKLAALVADRGRGLILLINKWDLTRDDADISSRSVEDAIREQLPHVAWAPHLFISAKTGKGVHRVLPMVKAVFTEFNKYVGSGKLNRWLQGTLATHSPPQRYHHPVRIYYATQARVRPPTFVLFANSPDGVPPAYQRFLQGRLRESFGYEGTPIRLFLRKRRKPGEERE